MSIESLIICVIALLFPYCFFLQFNPPYDLKIDTEGTSGATEQLCRLIWPLIIGTSLVSAGAALAWRTGFTILAFGLGVCALLLHALLFIPGAVAYKHSHGLNKNLRH